MRSRSARVPRFLWFLPPAAMLLGTACGETTTEVVVGPATAVAFSSHPENTIANTPIPPSAVVVRDDAGNTVETGNYQITVWIGANPGNADLSGNTSRGSLNGVATFIGLVISSPGIGYTLTANA